MSNVKKPTRPNVPPEPTVSERVKGLEALPWNALQVEVVEAHNALLKALKGEC